MDQDQINDLFNDLRSCLMTYNVTDECLPVVVCTPNHFITHHVQHALIIRNKEKLLSL